MTVDSLLDDYEFKLYYAEVAKPKWGRWVNFNYGGSDLWYVYVLLLEQSNGRTVTVKFENGVKIKFRRRK